MWQVIEERIGKGHGRKPVGPVHRRYLDAVVLCEALRRCEPDGVTYMVESTNGAGETK